MQIFVIQHKKAALPAIPEYVPLLVGAVRKDADLRAGRLCDDVGDNISHLNDSYCELTGLYWIWKHVSDDIIGLVHYRRYFVQIRHGFSFRGCLFLRNPSDCHILTLEEAQGLLGSSDLLVHFSRRYHIRLSRVLAGLTSEEVCRNLYSAMEKRPEYAAFCAYMKHHRIVQCNMFIGKKAVIDQYCAWLFPLLSDIDRLHSDSIGTRYQNRELGYVAEVLFGFWLEQNSIRIRGCHTVTPGNSAIRQIGGAMFADGSNVYPLHQIAESVLRPLRHRLKRKKA